MVTQWLITAIMTVVKWILDLLPTWTAPTWLSGIGADMQSLAAHVSKVGMWLPISALRNVILIVGPLVLVAVGVKIVRIVASFFTAGGGSAA